MSRRLKLGAKSEIENMCITFWCLTTGASQRWAAKMGIKEGSMNVGDFGSA
jgi:hypothetical protein